MNNFNNKNKPNKSSATKKRLFKISPAAALSSQLAFEEMERKEKIEAEQEDNNFARRLKKALIRYSDSFLCFQNALEDKYQVRTMFLY